MRKFPERSRKQFYMLTCFLFSSSESSTILAFVNMAEISLESVIDASKPTREEEHDILISVQNKLKSTAKEFRGEILDAEHMQVGNWYFPILCA